MFTVYVIQNTKGKLYKGVTGKLETRLSAHNEGLSPWTRNKGPWKLVYSEVYVDKREALKRERFLKTGQGREILKNILNGA